MKPFLGDDCPSYTIIPTTTPIATLPLETRNTPVTNTNTGDDLLTYEMLTSSKSDVDTMDDVTWLLTTEDATSDTILTTGQTRATPQFTSINIPAIEATIISSWNHHHAGLAVDMDHVTCAVTGYESAPWWKMKLARAAVVNGVRIVG